jgi:hypothetical protein
MTIPGPCTYAVAHPRKIILVLKAALEKGGKSNDFVFL